MNSFSAREKALCAQVDRLCTSDPAEAHALIDSIVSECTAEQKQSRTESAALSRICCRFLMHRKLKSRLTDILTQDTSLRRALFGELNTYKYSLVFLFRRLIRLNDTALTHELLTLMSENPFRDDSAKDYSDRWSLRFIIDEALSAPEDYLCLSDDSKNIIKKFITPPVE